MNIPDDLRLVFSGGNALGAYHVGAYEELAQRGFEPRQLAGSSIGAVTAAIIAGNPPHRRLDRLRTFWKRAEQFGKPRPFDAWHLRLPWLRWEKWSAGLQTLLAGRPGLFAPHLLGAWSALSPGSHKASLLDTSPLLEALPDLVDFSRLNNGEIRLAVLAVDVETGEEAVFDTKHMRVGPEHIRASAALPALLPPVEIDGRRFVDGGLSANLPVRLVLDETPGQDALCIALDLLPRKGERPRSIGAAAERIQDLVFASQSHHAIQALQLLHDLHQSASDGQTSQGATTLLHLAYGGNEDETAVKALDFSQTSLRARWTAGKADLSATADQFAALPGAAPGSLSVYRFAGGSLHRVERPPA